MSSYAHVSPAEQPLPASSNQQEYEVPEEGEMELDPKFILENGAQQIFNLFVPVSICMILTVVMAQAIPYFHKNEHLFVYAPFQSKSPSTGTLIWETVANVAIMMSIIILMTGLMVVLFKYQCYKCLYGWIIVTTVVLLFFIAIIHFGQIVKKMQIPVSNISFYFIMWNYGIMGLLAIHWKSPLIVQQSYLIIISMMMALIFLKNLPKYTCWILLGALVIWDVVAVLCPKGPLRMLIEMAQERNQPLLPALIYSTTATYQVIAAADDENRAIRGGDEPRVAYVNSSSDRPADQSQQPVLVDAEQQEQQHLQNNWREIQMSLEDRREHGVKLGLGDFIFYSLLIGRAALDADGTTIVACGLALLVGMCTTILVLGIFRKALPALPVSITCGILFYFVSSKSLSPFLDVLFDTRIIF